jgi:hypothetical protein
MTSDSPLDGITPADLAAIAELGRRGYDVRGKSPREVLELIHRGRLQKRSLPRPVNLQCGKQ